MKYELVKIEELCGDKATIYSIYVEEDQNTLFDNFVERHEISHKSEIEYILKTLEVISKEQGYREKFFKQNEGFLFSQIEAFYDKPKSNLRLYCINLGKTILILGGGGYKPKEIISWQDSEELSKINYFLQQVSKDYKIKIENKEIIFSPDNMKLEGNLKFGEEDD